MISWEDIANLNVSSDESLEGMRQRVENALAHGEDPSPEVALTLLDIVADYVQLAAGLRESIDTLSEELTRTQVYVLHLEARIEQAGLHLAEAPERVSARTIDAD